MFKYDYQEFDQDIWESELSNFVPDMTTVLTGTSIVPPPDFTLQEGDRVIISIENIGILENDVIEV